VGMWVFIMLGGGAADPAHVMNGWLLTVVGYQQAACTRATASISTPLPPPPPPGGRYTFETALLQSLHLH